uniref:Putative secreted protein n=1 Tax=Ixodes ricinus TaxID=34613 RepID=A0A090X9F9_IXORI
MNAAIILLLTSFLASVPLALQLPLAKNELKHSVGFGGEQPQATNSSSGLEQVGAVYRDGKSENARLVVQIDSPPAVWEYPRNGSSQLIDWKPASDRPRGELCGGPSVQRQSQRG